MIISCHTGLPAARDSCWHGRTHAGEATGSVVDPPPVAAPSAGDIDRVVKAEMVASV
jgi:hypothetical protein